MTESQQYYQSCNNYFWRWEDAGQVIAIPEESTIAYKNFVKEILEKLAVQGLPPFGSLLLAIIATNPNALRSIDSVYKIVSTAINTTDDILLAGTISFLKLLSEVPDNYKKDKYRILLFQTLFEECHNIMSVSDSLKSIQSFGSAVEQLASKDFSHAVFVRDFRTLELLQNKFKNVNDIISKIASVPEISHDALPLFEPDLENDNKKDFVDQLIENDKTFYTGSLIKRIWGGLNIPFHSFLSGQQPLGGFADITNKGNFDKLLISEFANEDIILLSRLANNEALYIHREVPTQNNNLERIILIDVSLKNWGTPRIIAFAVMLAIARHPKTNIDCSVYAVGNTFSPVAFDSVDSIMDGLQLLSGSLDGASGLDAFFEANPEHKKKEIFLLTESSVPKQPGMAAAISKYNAFIKYRIYTDAEGNIQVFKRQQNSLRHVQHIKLPLEQLWKKETKAIDDVREKKKNPDYPILFRMALNSRKILSTEYKEVYQVTSDKKLLRFYGDLVKPSERGWEMIDEILPFGGGEFEIGISDEGEHFLLMFNPQNRQLILLNINRGARQTILFTEWRSSAYKHFIFSGNAFYYLSSSNYWEISINGLITKHEKESVYLYNAYREREQELEKLAKTFSFAHSVFKNISQVYLNEENNLVLNQHELYLNQGKHIKLDQRKHMIKQIVAAQKSPNEFVFGDGSTIEVNRSGMLILKSACSDIPDIFIPSLIDSSLGAATSNAFAGNRFYYKEPQVEVILKSAGNNKLAIVDSFKKITGIELSDPARIDNTPSLLIPKVLKTTGATIKKKLEESGAEIELREAETEEIEQITPSVFFQNYIDPFIINIRTHGT